ncbi:hypothetical protein [Novosphingobium sp.]|jgi:hypothetical protein|uniref:hypothetical protein n=1 Tax=Novosphingobium sp. TaxID=1874826 RepID=UPI002FDFCA4A
MMTPVTKTGNKEPAIGILSKEPIERKAPKGVEEGAQKASGAGAGERERYRRKHS